MTDDLDRPVALPRLTLRQLNTIAAALKLAEVRYGLMLQLPCFDPIPALSHDEVGDLAEDLQQLAFAMTPNRRGRHG